MAWDHTVSFCGLDVTVRMEDSDGKSMIKHRRFDPLLEKIYPLDIQFYRRIPCPIINEKLKTLVKERILALKEVHLIMKNSDYATLIDKKKMVTSKLGIMRVHRYAKLINSNGHCTCSIEELDDRIADHASFIALRLALASNREDRFLHQRIEEELFYLRVSALDDEGIRELLAFNEIEYEKINNDERIKFKDELVELLLDSEDYDSTDFFKIPILPILGFIKVYDVFLKDGIAFVPLKQMRGVLCAHYHNYLEYEASAINPNNFEIACKFADGYDKFNEFFNFCCVEFQIMQQKVMKESNISVPMIDMLAKTAFPPCMRVIHEFLRKHHHLKHESRLQYTLFLKGIGLKVTDTLTLFRKEFVQTVTQERFEKEYTYYIYHAYGMRGRKYDMPSRDCHQIINGVTPFGDCNGCMFMSKGVADIEDLNRRMIQWDIPMQYMDEILQYTKSGHCGHACATYFQTINKCSLNGPVTHPNKFFNESRRVSNLPAGCISDESETSDNEDDRVDLCNDEVINIDNHPVPLDQSHDTYYELVQMIVDWEIQMSMKNIKPGSMIKLKCKV